MFTAEFTHDSIDDIDSVEEINNCKITDKTQQGIAMLIPLLTDDLPISTLFD